MNISSIIDKNRSLTLCSLVVILFTISAYLAYIISPELSKIFGYDASNIISPIQPINAIST